MNLSFLKSLIQLVESSNIEELEISRWGTRVRIAKSAAGPETADAKSAKANRAGVVEATRPAEPAAPQAPVAPAGPAGVAAAAGGGGETLAEIKSPMVGIFYRSPSPGAKPYVETGERLERGQVVCIIEAMKLMNEIQSEVAGRIVNVLVENAQPVEYGQPLFLVAP